MDHKMTQLIGDSLYYDFSPDVGSIELVVIDARHDEAHGFAYTRSKLALVRANGLILWDDFEPYLAWAH